jgi:uncharacterized protein YjbI with pentapeptide repeats
MGEPLSKPDWGQRLTAIASIATVAVAIAALIYTNNANRNQQRISEQGQITERFTRAVDQIGQTGAEKIAVRLGGIYALERIMRESQADEPAIIELLAAFLRTFSAVPEGGYQGVKVGSRGDPAPPLPPADLQAVVTVLGRRPRPELSENRVDLRKVNMRGANLHGANLAYADLRESYLYEADLTNANLTYGFLVSVDLRGADLTNAKLNEANLWGGDLKGSGQSVTVLKNADLTNAKAPFSSFYGANLTDAQLRGTDLAFADLDSTKLDGADLAGADLRFAHLYGADLTNARSLTPAQLAHTYGNDSTKLPPGLSVRPSPSPSPS